MKNITYKSLNEGLGNLYFSNLPIKEDQLEGNDWNPDSIKPKKMLFDFDDEEEDSESEMDECVLSSANRVMEAYQNANKWLDSVKEAVYSDMSCVFFSSFIHELAHTMPGRFDKFGDILHTANLKIPYPETRYIPQEPQTIEDAFDMIFNVLDNIKDALNDFIKCTDDRYHGMACSAETLLNDIEGEYPMLFRLRDEWRQCNGDQIKFDKYVNQYVKNKGDLLESLNEGAIGDFFSDRVDDVKSALGKRYIVQRHDKSRDYDRKGNFVGDNSEDEFTAFKHRTDADKYIKKQQKADNIDGNQVQYTKYGSLNRDEAGKRLDVAKYSKANQKINDKEQKSIDAEFNIGYQDTTKSTKHGSSNEFNDRVDSIRDYYQNERNQLKSDRDLELYRMGYRKKKNESADLFGEALCEDQEQQSFYQGNGCYETSDFYDTPDDEVLKDRDRDIYFDAGDYPTKQEFIDYALSKLPKGVDIVADDDPNKWLFYIWYNDEFIKTFRLDGVFDDGVEEIEAVLYQNGIFPDKFKESLTEDQQQSFYQGPGRYEVYTYMGTQSLRFFKYADFLSEDQYNKAVNYLGKNFAQAKKILENPDLKQDVHTVETDEGLKTTGGFNKALSSAVHSLKDKERGSGTYLHGGGLALSINGKTKAGASSDEKEGTGTDLVANVIDTVTDQTTQN